MAITPSALYTSLAITPGSTTQNSPSTLNAGALSANGLAFNFVVETGSNSVGNNAVIIFRYAFSINTYTATDAPAILGNSANVFRLRFPTAADSTFDITTQFITPILGSTLYYWFDQENVLASGGTLTASALPLTVTSYISTNN
jgi:hypothetical protein